MKISVITVCLDAERFLKEQLESVARQSWQDLEQIIVDGGSGDGTLDLLRAAALRDPRLTFVSGPDRGISDAMNKGMALATGDVVAFLHADDLYEDPQVLEQVAEAFSADPETQWVTGGMKHIDSGGRVLRTYRVRRFSYARLLRGNIVFHPATFVRRSALEAVGGFDASLRYTMDYDLWLRLGRRGYPTVLDRPLARFRVHPGSASTREVDAAFREELRVRLRYLKAKPLQKALHLVYFCAKYLPNRMSVRNADER